MSKRVAFVTGAARGIGAGIAKRLARQHVVAVGYRHRQSEADAVTDAIRDAGGEAFSVAVDVSLRESVRTALREIESRVGNVNVLVNNAAIAQEKPFAEINDADWSVMLATNLSGPFMLAQEVLPAMVASRWGRIVNVGSIGGQWGGVNQVHYAVAKSALIGLTKSLAKVYSATGITTNLIAPGLVATEMTSTELDTDAGKAKLRNIPAGRLGTVDEMAASVEFLAGDDAAYITGQTINLNGGMYFQT